MIRSVFFQRCGSSVFAAARASACGRTRLLSTAAARAAAENKCKKVPVTLLAGFLGSGKTTTLQNLLQNNKGYKIGVIVNDVAKINIDNKLLAKPPLTTEGTASGASSPPPSAAAPDTIDLQNGCACCSLSDELLTSVDRLLHRDDGGAQSGRRARRRDLDAIIVELSGVADPVAVRHNWNRAARDGDSPVTRLASIDKVVTLVDSSTFGTDWMSWDAAGDREGWSPPPDGDGGESSSSCATRRRVPELLAEQVEAADVLVVNKVDLAGRDQVAVATSLAKSLNDRAGLYETEFGKVSAKEVLGRRVVADDEEEEESLVVARPSDTTRLDRIGIDNFCYAADRPFVSSRLMEVLRKWPVPIKEDLDLDRLSTAADEVVDVDGQRTSPFEGVLRSKGFMWISPSKWIGHQEDAWRHDEAMYWSHAGKHFSVTGMGKWWSTFPRTQMKNHFANQNNDGDNSDNNNSSMKEYERILKEDFVTDEFGDRRQEIVFIGASLNEQGITEALNGCLATDKEMDEYRIEVAKKKTIAITAD